METNFHILPRNQTNQTIADQTSVENSANDASKLEQPSQAIAQNTLRTQLQQSISILIIAAPTPKPKESQNRNSSQQLGAPTTSLTKLPLQFKQANGLMHQAG